MRGWTDTNAQSRYRSLMSELGVVVAPAPDDARPIRSGYAGFQFSAELGDHHDQQQPQGQRRRAGIAYWDGIEGVNRRRSRASRVPSSSLTTVGGFVRKGLWFPLPAFEFGAGAVDVLGSHMYAMQGYAKIALQEGFHDWVLPSFAVRGSASQLLGTSQVNMTVYGVDVLISKAFGIGGTARIEPYFGWNVPVHRCPQRRHRRHAQLRRLRAAAVRGQRYRRPGSCLAGQQRHLERPRATTSRSRRRTSSPVTAGPSALKLKLSVVFVTAEGTSFRPAPATTATRDIVDSSGTQESFSPGRPGLDF